MDTNKRIKATIIAIIIALLFLGLSGTIVYFAINLSPSYNDLSSTLTSSRKHTVTFDANGGIFSKSEVVEVSHNTFVEEPTNPEKLGYIFKGWYYNGRLWYFDIYNVTEDIILTASYTRSTTSSGSTDGSTDDSNSGATGPNVDVSKTTYTVSYDANGGTLVGITGVVVNEGDRLSKPSDPIRQGYTFNGWFTSKNVEWIFTTYTVGESMTLYADWFVTPDAVYTVSYFANGGTLNSDETVSIVAGNKLTQPTDPTLSGQTFTGWYNAGVLWNFTSDVVSSNMTLIANWRETPKSTLTITYDVNGGTMSNAGIVVDKDGLFTVETDEFTYLSNPGDPTLSGYVFVGWYNTSTGNVWNFTTNYVTQAITLQANWVEEADGLYVITINAGGGTVKNLSGTSVSSYTESLAYGRYVTKPSDPTRVGYTFIDWYSDGKVWDFDAYTVDSNTIITAVWTANLYTVTYSANGGSLTGITSQNVYYDTLVSKPSDPVRTGYTFTGWYTNGNAWNFTTDKMGLSMTLVAGWKQIVYYVTFDSNGGTSVNSQSVVYGGTASSPTNPTRSGYTFNGWTLNGSTYNFSTAVTGNITLVASWSVTVTYYTVTFYDEYNRYYTSYTVASGSTITAPSYYSFNGMFNYWYSSGSVLYAGRTITVTGNRSYYADCEDYYNGNDGWHPSDDDMFESMGW